MKYIGQIFASIVYTCLFTGIMYLVITIPLAYVIAFQWWGILLYILIGGVLLEGLIQLMGTIGIMPYIWIVKNNIVATSISILLALFNVGTNIYNLWVSLAGHGTWAVIFGLVVTLLLLQFLFMLFTGITAIKSNKI